MHVAPLCALTVIPQKLLRRGPKLPPSEVCPMEALLQRTRQQEQVSARH